MKHILLFLTTIVFTGSVAGQAPAIDQKQVYMQKHSKLNTGAWVSLGGGVALVAVAAAIAPPVLSELDCLFCNNPVQSQKKDYTASNVLAIVGVTAMVASIPLFIIAHNNKVKATSIGIITQPLYLPNGVTYAGRVLPAIGFRVSF